MKTRDSIDETSVYEGSGNIFQDLNLPDPQEHEIKAQLALRINGSIDAIGATQAQIAKRLHIKQPTVSLLRNYKLQGFSVERLMQFLVHLGHSVAINVSTERTVKAGITVTSAAKEARLSRPSPRSFREFPADWNVICSSSPNPQKKVKLLYGYQEPEDSSPHVERMTAEFTAYNRMRAQ